VGKRLFDIHALGFVEHEETFDEVFWSLANIPPLFVPFNDVKVALGGQLKDDTPRIAAVVWMVTIGKDYFTSKHSTCDGSHRPHIDGFGVAGLTSNGWIFLVDLTAENFSFEGT